MKYNDVEIAIMCIKGILKRKPKYVGYHVCKEKFEITFKFRIKENNYEEFIEAASAFIKCDKGKLNKKCQHWIISYKNGQWCKHCGKRPIAKNNRYFCSICHSNNGNVINMHDSGGTRITRAGNTRVD